MGLMPMVSLSQSLSLNTQRCGPCTAIVLQEDTDVPVLALVDLYASQPVSAPAAGASNLSSQYPAARLRMAGLFYVHKGLYDERPGMRLLQVCLAGHSRRVTAVPKPHGFEQGGLQQTCLCSAPAT